MYNDHVAEPFRTILNNFAQGTLMEKVCQRCRRVCFSQEQFENHECFDMDDMIDAEIALCKWIKDGQPMPKE